MRNTPGLTAGYAPELAQQIALTVAGMAHFAGTGPFARTCAECAFLSYWRQTRDSAGNTTKTTRSGGCEKHFELTGKHGAKVPPNTPACRYFKPRAGAP